VALSQAAGQPIAKPSSGVAAVYSDPGRTPAGGKNYAGAASGHPETWGRLVESAVGAHLLNTASPGMQITYWREGNKEVDFVVNIRDRLLAIEVKSGRRTRALSGLLAFQRQFPKAQTMVVGTGGIPTEEFLSRSAADWFRDIASLPSP